MIELALALIACHLLGDYVLQGDYLATTKGKNFYNLFVHCFLYCIPFYFCFNEWYQLIFLFVSHIIIDTLKAKYGLINYGADQLLHYICLLVYFF